METNIGNVFKNADPFWGNLLNKYQKKLISKEQFNLSIYSKMTDEPHKYLYSMKPTDLSMDWFILNTIYDVDNKIINIYQENLGSAQFLWDAFLDLNKFELNTLAELFKNQFDLYQNWFINNGNIILNLSTINPQEQLISYFNSLFSGFREWISELKKENNNNIPRFKFYNIKTGEGRI